MLHVYNNVTYLTRVHSRESSCQEPDHCTVTGCDVKSATSECPMSHVNCENNKQHHMALSTCFHHFGHALSTFIL